MMNPDLKKHNRTIRILWIVFGSSVTFLILLFWFISMGWLGFMPSFEDLENPNSQVASQIITSDQQLLGKYFKEENRILVQYENLSPFLVKALVATEDERFYSHSGIDVKGVIRAMKGIATGSSSSGGGSTISQQLAKLLFPRENMSKFELVLRKFKEWVIAVKLERSYTKEEIITMYLNKFEFIHGAFGIEVASKTYFNVSPDSLELHQSAMLVGMLKNPSLYNPIKSESRALQRRNVVLHQMQKNGYINKTQLEVTKLMPLDLDFQRDELKQGIAPYFRKYLERTMIAVKPEREAYGNSYLSVQRFREDSTAWANDPLYGWCNKNHKPQGGGYDLYKDGLKIYTTINYKMQDYAETSVREHLTRLQPQLNNHVKNFKNAPFSNDITTEEAQRVLLNEIRRSDRYKAMKKKDWDIDQIMNEFAKPDTMQVYTWRGYIDTIMSPIDSIKHYLRNLSSSFMAMDPRSGEVKAWVGGAGYGFTEIDMVRSSTYKRQVGSTCKPFLYTLAMQNGLSPCKLVPNVEQTFLLDDGTSWTAKNSTRDTIHEGRMVTLKWGLANSVNQVSAWIMKQYNPASVVRIMRRMGVYSDVPAVPSLFLGTAEVTLYEMVASYSVYANSGIYTTPIVVTRIEDKNGNLLAKFEPRRHDALDEKTAYLMVSLMQGVVREGSGARLISRADIHKTYGAFTTPLAGKTGTTQNQSDGWFVGYTPELVAGVWTGANYRSIHFEDISRGQGSNMALPVFGRFFKKVFADTSLHYSSTADFVPPAGFNVNLNCNDPNDDLPSRIDEIDEFF
jgi:penicillin-binding protein 1A